MNHIAQIYATVAPPVHLIPEMEKKYSTWNYTYPIIPRKPLHPTQLLFTGPVLARTSLQCIRKSKIPKKKNVGTTND
jgi:hypothetical protein